LVIIVDRTLTRSDAGEGAGQRFIMIDDDSARIVRETYYTTATTTGTVRYNRFSFSIGVNPSPNEQTPIGSAFQVGRTDRGWALWALKVRGVEVPGRYIVVDGVFVLEVPG
jgi:hypothetical protein